MPRYVIKPFDDKLIPIINKVYAKERLSYEDGITLYQSRDLSTIARLADKVRKDRFGLKTFYVKSRRLSYTNICFTHCQFCAFQAKPDDPRAYVLSAEDIINELHKPINDGVRELHMVAGHYPKLKIDYFTDLFQKIKKAFPNIHLKVFTMVEMDYYAKVSNLSVSEFLDRCIAAGLESCPGGGAEIFDEGIRAKICIGKKDANVWIDNARLCHQKGIPTNCTMLYGHIESIEHKVDHLLRLRDLQDETGGFLSYIPLAYQNEDNELAKTYKIHPTSGLTDLREIAVGRLLLDNIPHIKAYWVMISEGLAQIALSYGANDIDGTVIEEEIAHNAGAKTPQHLTEDQLRALITTAGYTPIERDNLYNEFPSVGASTL